MPLYPPRNEAVKKKEQLSKKEIELYSALRNGFSNEKLIKFVERFRLAQLALFKARLHEIREKEFENKKSNLNGAKLENEISEWNKKSSDAIIMEIKAKLK
jgi:hypothetical protein